MIRHGALVELGPHEALVEKGGVYAQIHAAYERGQTVLPTASASTAA